MAIPFFSLAGTFLTRGEVAKRMIALPRDRLFRGVGKGIVL